MEKKFSLITALVIETKQVTRTQIRSLLDGLGISQVQFASSASSAIRILQDEVFDLILCAHNLGDEQQDGQHLLEDLRTNALISRQTLFFILYDSAHQQEVMGAADLSPDGVLVKPFTAHVLQSRLTQALKRREHFMPLFRAIQEGRTELAIEYCLHAEERHPLYRNDFARERSELLFADGQHQEAHEIFAEIAAGESHPPWAELGVVRCLIALHQLDEAQARLMSLLKEHPMFLAANDCRTQIFEARGDLLAARQSLEDTLKLAPNRISRLRACARLSLQLEDPSAAEEAMSKVLSNNRYSIFRDPQDHLRMLNLLLDGQRLEEADNILGKLERGFGEASLNVLCRDLARSRMANARGDEANAAAFALSAYRHLQQIGLDALGDSLNDDTLQEMTSQLLENELEEEACALTRERIRTAPNQQSLTAARAALRELGRTDLAEEIEARLEDTAHEYLDRSEELDKEGKPEEAVLVLMQATSALPGNPDILVNTAIALIRSLREQGWVMGTADHAMALLVRARQIDPENSRANQLIRHLKQLARERKIENAFNIDPAAPEAQASRSANE
ncbi:MAG: tetratricopeptide repeat protein [Rhodocyclaceae bacterium]|nr:tetratricopeptide repeat protein [Rhodocyclaceae bacterium]